MSEPDYMEVKMAQGATNNEPVSPSESMESLQLAGSLPSSRSGYQRAPTGSPPNVSSESAHANPFTNLSDIARQEASFEDDSDNLALFQAESHRRPRVARILSNLVRLQGEEQQGLDAESSMLALLRKQPVKLGLMSGVYLPTIQNILGVLLYLRLAWLVGSAGVGQSLLIVFICCTTTLLTAISMSAIATNGVVPAGGAYFMISRSLGPEFGGAVGILFYLGTTFASSMYTLGAVELLLTYMVPGMSAFGDAAPGSAAMLSNMRLYGTIVLFGMAFIVFVGVKYVNRFAGLCLVMVVVSIFCIYIGFLASPMPRQPDICFIDGNLMSSDYSGSCTSSDFRNYSWQSNQTTFSGSVKGFPGLGSGTLPHNVKSAYVNEGDSLSGAASQPQQVTADITTTFTLLLAIFFPACTGIMAGSNRSGDLADASRSIPLGTIAAIITTTVIYVTMILFLGGAVEGQLLRDKFGDSINGGLVIAEVAWPHPSVILIGALLSTIGAGLQSLTGAPRLLQAIAQDNVLPFLTYFGKASASGEPTRALVLTALISELGVIIASLDAVAPLVTQFFLLCYGFVNLACTLQSLLRSPSWRPRFQYYHWGLSAIGLTLCVLLMFISSWVYAIVTTFLATAVYYYIEFKGAVKEWGDGIAGLSMQAARYSLLRLEDSQPHTKNWRPQLLTFCKLKQETLDVAEPRLISLAGHLKGGKGLNIVAAVVPGNYRTCPSDKVAGKFALRKAMKAADVQGFAEVVVSHDVCQGASFLIQAAGLGAMQHNSVLIGWPEGWRQRFEASQTEGDDDVMLGSLEQVAFFTEVISTCDVQQQAVIVPKNLHLFPELSERLDGTIDVWWIIDDGGMLILLAFLLQQESVWRKCSLRIFTVAENDDNTIQMQRDLQTFMYHLRINAEVHVVEMLDSDISAYTVARAQKLDDRRDVMNKLNLTKKQRMRIPENIVNRSVSLRPRARSTTSTRGTESEAVKMMNTSVKLNRIINEHSKDAALVLLNLPGPPDDLGEDLEKATNYLEFVEVLTENLKRVLLIRGGGREVVTIFS